MKGARPLSREEIQKVQGSFSGKYALRDQALFVLCYTTGYRISEALSLLVSDAIQQGKLVDRIAVKRCNMKKKQEGRIVPFHSDAKAAVSLWVHELAQCTQIDDETFLFRSREGRNKSISRIQAWRILKKAYRVAGLIGPGLSCHSTRKFFAAVLYEKFNHDLIKLQRSLSHKSVSSTASYLSFKEDEIEKAILAI